MTTTIAPPAPGSVWRFKLDRGNPFATSNVMVLDVQDGWVKYAYCHTEAGRWDMSKSLDAFLADYERKTP